MLSYMTNMTQALACIRVIIVLRKVSYMSQIKLSESPTSEVVAVVNELGLQRAARKFKTSPATLSRWLKAQDFKLKRIYVRKELAS